MPAKFEGVFLLRETIAEFFDNVGKFTPISSVHERRYQLAVAKLRRVAADLDGVDTSVEVRDGTAAAALVKAATDYGADLILLGTYEHGAMQHWIASGLDERLRCDAHCPVLAVRK